MSEEQLRRMVDALSATGALAPEWRESFLAVPRHRFLPDLVWRRDEHTEQAHNLIPLHRAENSQAWLDLAYADEFVITQVDDGHPTGPGRTGFDITSSASMPTMVAIMLAALDAQPGMRVCEIGTGTGYNAALLAHRLGAEQITSIEIDPQVAAHAQHALAGTGYQQVTVVAGDGACGYPSQAPYDRVISTANVHHVPYPWIAQTCPGGKVLTPWGTPYYTGGLLSLAVADDGTAHGSLVDQACFMDLRDQRSPRVSIRRCVHDEDQGICTSAELHPWRVAGHYDVGIAIGLRVPRCKQLYQPAPDPTSEAILWFLDPWSGSWASLHHVPDVASDAYPVRQLGPRRLWDEIEAAYRWWVDLGEPTAGQWTFTITPHEQNVTFGGRMVPLVDATPLWS